MGIIVQSQHICCSCALSLLTLFSSIFARAIHKTKIYLCADSANRNENENFIFHRQEWKWKNVSQQESDVHETRENKRNASQSRINFNIQNNFLCFFSFFSWLVSSISSDVAVICYGRRCLYVFFRGFSLFCWRTNAAAADVATTDQPQVTLQLGSTLNPDDIKEGDDVYFECQIKANPKEHRITWWHDVSTCTLFHCVFSTHFRLCVCMCVRFIIRKNLNLLCVRRNLFAFV